MRRARPRSSRVLMFLSLVLGVLTTLALRGHLARLEARAAAAGPGAPVVVMSAHVERGAVLGTEVLDVRRIPAPYRPPGALTDVAQAVGRIVASDMAAGEPVTETRLAPPGGPVAALVPPGLRAFPVEAAVPRGTVAGGDRVDVLATFATGAPHTETVASEAEVLSVVPGAAHDEFGGGSTIILLVGPETAERLAHARAFAELAIAVAPAGEPA
jgi:pilus assembly protein CpaB